MTAPLRQFPPVLKLALLITLIHLVVIVALRGDVAPPEATLNALYDAVILSCTLTCLLAWRQAPAHLRRGLGLLGAAMLSRLVADVIWSWIEFTSGTLPFPSVADAFYLLEFPLFGAAFVQLSAVPLRPLKAVRLFLDSLIVVGALTTFLWWWVLHSFVGSPGTPLLGTLVNFAYPVFDLALLVILLMVVLHGRRLHRHLGLFALGFGFTAVADLSFVLLAEQGRYYTGHPIDPIFTAGFLLWALGAWQARLDAPAAAADLTEESPRRPLLLQQTLAGLPYVAVTAACLFLLALPYGSTLRERGVLIGTVLSMLLVVARQAVAFADNHRLTQDLRRSHHELEQSRARLAHQVRHDPLTGLPNRTSFEDHLTRTLERAAGTGEPFAVCFLDLDGFKAINDAHGHTAGDGLLVQVAARLRGVLRPGDVVARQGGDEFLALLVPADAAQAQALGLRLLSAFSAPFTVQGQSVPVGASVGVSLYPHDGREVGDLRRCADLAMYRAKKAGRNRLQFSAQEAPVPVPEEERLRGALARGDLTLHYQPQYDPSGQHIVAAEALLRWTDAELGSVPPDRFIPVAEVSGLIGPIGLWVLNEACQQLATWRALGWPGRVAVNVSPVQLTQPGFQQEVLETLRHHGLRGENLELEITEGAVLEDAQQASGQLARLREVGVRIAVDDFGMGHAALLYLLAFPVHLLKIDRQFVQGAVEREHDRQVVQALVTFARALRLEVVAEGVETEAQRALMQQLGVGLMQGYLLGRPLPAEEFTARLLRQLRPQISLH